MVKPDEFKLLWKVIKKWQEAGKDPSTLPALKLILSEWYHDSRSEQDLRAKLMKTIGEYEELRISLLPTEDKTAIDSLIYALRTQLKRIPNKNISYSQNLEEKSKIGLSEVFKYYSRQQFLLGKNPTFDNIQKNLEVLTLGKFTKFCKDFGVISSNKTDRDSKKRGKSLKIIFKHNSDFNRDMHEHQFFSAVSALAEFYLDKDYDAAHSTDWTSLNPQEKTLKLYELLGVYDPQIYMQRMKDSVLHFGGDPCTRIPENDPSKRYKYNPEKYKKLKMSVDEWRSRKALEEKEKQEEPRRVRKPKQSSSTPRMPTGENSKGMGKDVFTNRPVATKDIVVEKPGYSKGYYKENTIKTNSLSINPETTKSLTLRKLSEMNQDELLKVDREYAVADLIEETSSEDELLTKFLIKPVPTRPIGKSISQQVLDRGKALDLQNKISENSKYQKLLKLSDAHMEKSLAYLTKK